MNTRSKHEVLGQYFTKLEVVENLLKVLFIHKNYEKEINILEPSFGTGNFIKGLNDLGFISIEGCEIDKELTSKPSDFFALPMKKKYDLIIGNPPFTKYNVQESYYYKSRYGSASLNPDDYLIDNCLKNGRTKIENAFLLKSLNHLKDEHSTIAFILPISFFIKGKNRFVKDHLIKHFSSIIIYQNEKNWFDRPIPCCFAILTNCKNLKNKIKVIFENGEEDINIFDINQINDELIPQVIFHKNNSLTDNNGRPLFEYLALNNVRARKSFKVNNISAKNISEKSKIPEGYAIDDYKIAICRVGNSSVGKCGLINIREDIINDMFYVFDVLPNYRDDKLLKELICQSLNTNQDYFKKITCRVGSKSIKKEDVLNFKVPA